MDLFFNIVLCRESFQLPVYICGILALNQAFNLVVLDIACSQCIKALVVAQLHIKQTGLCIILRSGILGRSFGAADLCQLQCCDIHTLAGCLHDQDVLALGKLIFAQNGLIPVLGNGHIFHCIRTYHSSLYFCSSHSLCRSRDQPCLGAEGRGGVLAVKYDLILARLGHIQPDRYPVIRAKCRSQAELTGNKLNLAAVRALFPGLDHPVVDCRISVFHCALDSSFVVLIICTGDLIGEIAVVIQLKLKYIVLECKGRLSALLGNTGAFRRIAGHRRFAGSCSGSQVDIRNGSTVSVGVETDHQNVIALCKGVGSYNRRGAIGCNICRTHGIRAIHCFLYLSRSHGLSRRSKGNHDSLIRISRCVASGERYLIIASLRHIDAQCDPFICLKIGNTQTFVTV